MRDFIVVCKLKRSGLEAWRMTVIASSRAAAIEEAKRGCTIKDFALFEARLKKPEDERCVLCSKPYEKHLGDLMHCPSPMEMMA